MSSQTVPGSCTHDVRAVGVVEGTRGASIAHQHLGHVLRLVLGETDEAHTRAGEHAQLVLLLRKRTIGCLLLLHDYQNSVKEN